MRTKIIGVVIAMCAATSSLAATKTEKIDLRLHLQTGQSFKMEQATDFVIVFKPRGREKRITETKLFSYKMAVESVDSKGIASLNVTYDKIKVKENNYSQESDFDSTMPSTVKHPEERVYLALIGRSFKLKVASNGDIEGISGVKELYNHVMMNLGDAATGEARTIAESTADQLLGDFSLTLKMEPFFNIYPNKPISENERWSGDSVENMDFACLEQQFCKITQSTNDEVKIKLFRDYRPNPSDERIRGKDATLKLALSGKSEGTATCEQSRGLIKRLQLNGELAGKLTVISAEYSIEVPATVKMSETVTSQAIDIP